MTQVPEAENQPDIKGPWYLFNDFVVWNITEEEALSFPGIWKGYHTIFPMNSADFIPDSSRLIL